MDRATDATEEYSKSEVKEKVELLLSEYAINKATGENENFADFLRKNLQVGVAENDDNTYSFILGEWQVVTDENKVISIEKFKLDVDKTYPDVASMKADTELIDGQLVQTESYWDKQHAGGAYYDIVNSTSLTVDDGECIQLDNGLYAELHPINDTVTVNQFGAYGDGSTDDTDAFKKCIEADMKNVNLSGEYLITSTVSTEKDKSFFDGKILCEVNQERALSFDGNVSFYGTEFTSSIDTTGTSPHGETYEHTSNLDFVDVWGEKAIFIDCTFNNAKAAIRGRISTGATIVPENLYVSNCTFIECKIPVGGFFAIANIEKSHFKNSGDVYSGDHCVYIESYGAKELNIKECNVETYNSESGSAFQIYGKLEQQTTIPKMNIENCIINANAIASTDLADVVVSNSTFVAQRSKYVFAVEDGSFLIEGCNMNFAKFISEATWSETQIPRVIARNSEFKINKELVTSGDRAMFPAESTNCKFINWGGYVYYDDTKINNCIFTRDTDHVVGNYYISVNEGDGIHIENSAFKSGDNIAYNSLGTIYLTNCYYTNEIGINVPNVIEEGTIREDITD